MEREKGEEGEKSKVKGRGEVGKNVVGGKKEGEVGGVGVGSVVVKIEGGKKKGEEGDGGEVVAERV